MSLSVEMPIVKRNDFPLEVQKLRRREREIATIVYSNGYGTAKDVQSALTDQLTNAAIRSMLNRLVRKCILKRHRKEDSFEYVYRPAISHSASRERALRQLAEDFFGGSLQEVAAVLLSLGPKTASHHRNRFTAE